MARVGVPSAPGAWLRRAFLGLLVVAVLFSVLDGFLIDAAWFREVGFADRFWTVVGTRLGLGGAFGLIFFVLLYVNLRIARALSPSLLQTAAGRFDPIARYRMALEPILRWLLPLAAAAVALVVGLGVTGRWEEYLLWRNSSGVVFGTTDPIFGRDIAYYVFTLPWHRFVQSWLFSSLVGVTILTAFAHLVWGGIRPDAGGPIGARVTPQVKAHLSVLIGLIVLVKAWGYLLGQYGLLASVRGVVVGASFTDIEAQLPALRLLVVVAVVCAVLFLVNIRLRGWALPVIAVGLLAVVSVLAGGAYPAFVQRFRVEPQELQRERPFIERNIAATRAAFGLDEVEAVNRAVASAVTAEDAKVEESVLANIRVWRPDILQDGIKSLQRIRQYYEFADVDVDRYVIDGERRLVMVSAREITQSGIPGGGTWQNRHLVFTHGYGAVATTVNTATPEGAPVFTLKDIPAVGEPAIDEVGQRVYFGELTDVPFVVVGTGTEELDYQGTATDEGAQATTTYEGEGGIPIGNLASRALFAWRFRDVNLLISGLIRPESRILIYRDIEERAPRVAPFLTFDSDPYAAIVDGRLVWIWDAYTTTDRYPYAQPIALEDVTAPSVAGPSPSGVVNYIRNSVKVVIDAYDGSITYYLVDETDPIAQVWSRAFPDLFTPEAEASADLRAHFRYPENLFQVQAAQYARYHVTDPTVFYGNQDAWQIPVDPTFEGGTAPMRPYYLLLRLPGEEEAGFVLILPFTPQGRQNMVSWMMARSDAGPNYGEIVNYQFPSSQTIEGPQQVFARLNQDARFSADRTLLGQGGSNVEFGDLLVIPVGESLLYVQPVYVSSQANAIPELKRVLVVNGGQIGIGATLSEALNDTLGDDVVPPDGGGTGGGESGGGGGGGGGTTEDRVRALLAEAVGHFDAAEAALRAGDLATYQDEVRAAETAIAEAARLAGTGTGG
jgi:uncharacterized membrane protein (UPF0182 family)